MCSPAGAPGGNVLSFKPAQMLFNSSKQPDVGLWGWYVSPCLRQQSRSCFLCNFGEGAACVCSKTLHYTQSFQYFFYSLSLFSSPAFISHWPTVAYTHARAYNSAYIALEFQLLAQSFCHGRKAQSASEDSDWKGRIKLVSHSLDLWLFECLAGTLGYMRAVCRQTALTNLQQMPTAARAAGHCQCMRRPWMPPNKYFSPSCMPLENPRQLGWFFCMMAAAQPGSEAMC